MQDLGLQVVAATAGLEWSSWLDQRGPLSQQVVRALCERLGRWGLWPYRDFGPLIAVAAQRPEENA